MIAPTSSVRMNAGRNPNELPGEGVYECVVGIPVENIVENAEAVLAVKAGMLLRKPLACALVLLFLLDSDLSA